MRAIAGVKQPYSGVIQWGMTLSLVHTPFMRHAPLDYTRIRLFQPRDGSHESGLTNPIGALDDGHLTFVEVQVDGLK